MGRQLRVQRPPIRNISDLLDRFINIRYNLSPIIYQGLVASKSRRVEAVLCAKGKKQDFRCAKILPPSKGKEMKPSLISIASSLVPKPKFNERFEPLDDTLGR
ncbi:hypothetical protein NPIL_201981 [Nephila pilipes]|uniref:Uncharacterized protein n=1 Tax=Nephila pilipes TaxID=299642 RepID=A0A8X6UPG8_NEPPI|nr:hypothetical protein NPIL_201981 [Nephila pilipes]